jgi:penicillin amidase
VCADDGGHIAHVVAGFVPVRNRGDGRRIARAWQDEGRWIAFIPFEELPQRRDPKNGYIVSANNITFDRDAYPYPWSFHDVDRSRAERIIQLLTAEPKVDAATMKRIQSDRRSGLSDDYVPLFIQAAKEDEALTDARLVLERWDRNTGPDSAGAALYYVALDELAHKVLEDDLGPDLYNALFSTYLCEVAVLQIMADKKHPFQQIASHQGKETWDLNYRRALSAAYARLQREQGADPQKWRWGALHTMTNAHALGEEKALAPSVNIGPEEHGGSFDTVWAAFIPFGRSRFDTFDGPAYRHIVDLANPDRGWIVLDTGEWGQPLTEHYADMHEMWRRNDLAPALMNRAEIEENVLGSLILEPAKMP